MRRTALFNIFRDIFLALSPERVPQTERNKPCFDLRGRRSRVSWRLQAALGTPSARRGVVWVYPVVALPGGGGPGARESAARGRDLSGRPRLSTQPPPPPVLYGETDGVLEFSTLKYII